MPPPQKQKQNKITHIGVVFFLKMKYLASFIHFCPHDINTHQISWGKMKNKIK
jgi:hypothetical protein